MDVDKHPQEAAGEASGALQFTYPLIKKTDMNEEMRVEVFEICVAICEKHSGNIEVILVAGMSNLDI